MAEVTCSRVNKDGKDLKVTVRARSHTLLADALIVDGGTDQGPTPHEILAGALAACTSITVQMYANRKAWPLKSADVTVRLNKESSDLNQTEHFDVTVSFQGDLSVEQRDRLLEIAYRCPVHKALSGSIAIKVALA